MSPPYGNGCEQRYGVCGSRELRYAVCMVECLTNLHESSRRARLSRFFMSSDPSILPPVADVVFRRVVVPPVDLPEPGTIKVHRDGRLFGGVTDLVDALLVRQHGRDPIFHAPLDPPELLQAGVIGHRAVIEALVSFFEDGSHDATE